MSARYPSSGYHRDAPRLMPEDGLGLDPLKAPRVLDVIGCNRELTVCGHIDLLRVLPVRHRMHIQLLEAYSRDPGNYEGKFSENNDSRAKVTDHGSGYLSIRLQDDISRPELSEFLLVKGWKMIGYGVQREDKKIFIAEKWTNVRNT